MATYGQIMVQWLCLGFILRWLHVRLLLEKVATRPDFHLWFSLPIIISPLLHTRTLLAPKLYSPIQTTLYPFKLDTSFLWAGIWIVTNKEVVVLHYQKHQLHALNGQQTTHTTWHHNMWDSLHGWLQYQYSLQKRITNICVCFTATAACILIIRTVNTVIVKATVLIKYSWCSISEDILRILERKQWEKSDNKLIRHHTHQSTTICYSHCHFVQHL
jgi:hypothetical protein